MCFLSCVYNRGNCLLSQSICRVMTEQNIDLSGECACSERLVLLTVEFFPDISDGYGLLFAFEELLKGY